MAPTLHQRGQFEHKFKKMVRCYNFFQKWTILTQNSNLTNKSIDLESNTHYKYVIYILLKLKIFIKKINYVKKLKINNI